ncbi:hypothetical protein ONZ43_g3207 [Nemania bipapillata]|uniref:Uncharacterized protein n=1 Tax=Nemania bipapillata TaxID=110536 RepID=A0ACC2IXK3_9PEZI|nr:hypothetical protein ONZ43_g3207 [Nemania bipapillata]
MVRGANGLLISAAAEPLFRWDRRPPETIFKDGFLPLLTPMNMDEFSETPDINLHLHRYINDQVRSIFVSTTRGVPQDARGGPVKIWIPPVLNGRYRYEIFAYGGVDILTSFGIQKEVMYPEQEEITFIGGIRPELIRSATQYDEKGRVISVSPNPRFDPRFNGDYAPRISELPEFVKHSISFSDPASGRRAPGPRRGKAVQGDDADECNGNFARYRLAQLGMPSMDLTGAFRDPAVNVKVVISPSDGRQPPISLQQLSSVVAELTGSRGRIYSVEAVSWDEATRRKLKLIGSNPFGLFHTWMSSSDYQKLYDYGEKGTMPLPWPTPDTGLDKINRRINALPDNTPSETRDSISWDTMNMHVTYQNPGQPEAICGVRADEVAKAFGLPPSKPGKADYQWLYWRPPALVGPRNRPFKNVFFGTKECKAHMLRFEYAIASLILRKPKTYLPLNSTCDFDPFSRYCPLLVELQLDDAVLEKYLDTSP